MGKLTTEQFSTKRIAAETGLAEWMERWPVD